MRICIPVDEDNGVKSVVSEHFGSAPFFMIVDTESKTCKTLPNTNRHHGHGMCAPLQSLQDEQLDAVAVQNIGAGAIGKLQSAGIQALQCNELTVEATLAALQNGLLSPMSPGETCAHHRHEHGQGCQ